MGLFGSKKKVEKKEENLSSIKEGVIGSSSGLSTPTNPSSPPSPPSPPSPQNAPSSLGSSSSVSSSQNLSNSVSNSNLGATDVNSSLSSSQDIPKPDSSGLENFDVPSLNVDDNSVNDDLFNLDDLNLGLEDLTNEVDKSHSSVVDTQIEESKYMKHKVNYDKPIFITTEQFKNVLEHIDFVKSKVKEASDTYLRLIDIKAEEDIEYENMRKDFQTIEEKLYEIDNILFEG